jgi:hypothetical protein
MSVTAVFATIKDNLTMRVKPSVPVGVGLAVGYTALFGGLFALSGVDYDDLSSSADNALKAIVIHPHQIASNTKNSESQPSERKPLHLAIPRTG